jgi:hypothetical protein
MQPAPIPPHIQARAPDLARRIGLIVAGLAALVASRFLREPRLACLIVPLWTCLTRTAGRFDRLMARLAANRPPKPRQPGPRRPRQATRPASVLPTAPGWLIRALPNEAAAYAGQLESLLAEPGTADLLAAFPAAGRILRPLGRMLGLRAPRTTPLHPEAPRRRTAAPPRASRIGPNAPPHDPSYRPSANWPAACRRRAIPA